MKRTIVLLLSLLPMVLFGYTTVNGDVSGQNWGNGTYYVSEDVYVNVDAILTIGSGAVIKFAMETGLTVNGTLDANGLSTSNIKFTSSNDNTSGEIIVGSTGSPQLGDWKGIYLNGSSSAQGIGEFDYCRVRYGGDAGGTADANIYFDESDSGYFNNSICEYSSQHGVKTHNTTIEILNSTFDNNSENGINNVYSGELDIDNCQFNNNGNYAAYLDNLSEINTYTNNSATGNGVDAFGLSGYVTENVTIGESICGLPFIIIERLTINSTDTLTISEGEVIKSNSDGQFIVNGTLIANGTESNPIVFTSLQDDVYGGDLNNNGSVTTPVAGDWGGIYLNGSSSFQGVGEFDYCRVRYGGDAGGTADANIYFDTSDSGYFNNSICDYSSQHGIKTHNTTIEILNSTFDNNSENGINNVYSGELDIDNCQFNNNGNYAAYLDNLSEINTYTNNSATGNGVDAFGLSGYVTENVTIGESICGLSFIIIERLTVNPTDTLTIPEGEVIKSNSDGQFIVNGTLIANGTESNPIVFTSLQDDVYGGDLNNDGAVTTPIAGDWKGIYLNGSSSIGEFDYCRVRYGGNIDGLAGANIYFDTSDSGYFNNSICEYSSQHGVKIDDSSPSFKSSTFQDNATNGVYISGGSNPDFGTNDKGLGQNTFKDNDSGNYQLYNASTNTINAYHNIWEFTNSDSIDAHIYDNDENASYGEVLFDPWFVENIEISTISENPLDFGIVYYDSNATLPLVVKNTGNVNLYISDISISADTTGVFDFTYEGLNLPISQGEQDTIFVDFTPSSEQSYTDTLNIINNSTNEPILKITLNGICEYDEVLSPENVNILVQNGNATISWDAVTETVHGVPVDIDFYVLNYSEQVELDPETYYHLTATENLSYVHERVEQFSNKMFYQVIAIRDYEGIYKNLFDKKNHPLKKIKWVDLKMMNGE